MTRTTLWVLAATALTACSGGDVNDQRADAGVPRGAGSADAGVRDAGLPNCQITDSVSDLCLLEGLGAQAQCRPGAFAQGHRWIREAGATPVLYVSATGQGDGATVDTPTRSPAEVLGDGVTGAIVVLSKGEHDLELPAVDDLTIIGACPGETTLALANRGPLSRGAGQRLRLWGLTVTNDGDGEAGVAINAAAGASVTVHQSVFSQVHQVLSASGPSSIELRNNTVGAASADAINASGAVSGIIVEDNHFLGPISGEGVFLGPISGEGVFRVVQNTFEALGGSAVLVSEAATSIIVEDNHFLGPISGEGVFLGPISGEGVFRVSSNRFEQIGTDGLVVMESAQSGEITGNTFSGPIGGDAMNLVGNLETSTISLRNNSSTGAGGAGLIIAEGTATYAITGNTIADSGGPGLCLIDLESPGSVRAENNTITDAVGIGVEVLRNSAEVELLANTITGTSVAEVGPIDRDAAMAYGVALFDSKATTIRNNRIQENESAGILADMTDWGIYFRRPDLSGDSNVVVRENTFGSNGGGRNLVLQNINPEAQLDADTDPDQPAAAELLPAVRSSRAFRCGNGRLDGTEECDSGVAGGTDDCSANCRLRRGTMLAGGNNFLCTVSFIGRVTCRGDNEYGAVDPGQRYTPEAFVRRNDLPSGVLQVAAGAKAGCVRTAGGQVSCWGGGQLGRNQRARNGQPAGLVQRFEGDELVSLTDVRDLAMGGDMACAVRNDGSIACWGEGSLGDGYPVEQEHTTAQRIVQGDQVTPSGETSPIEDARQVAVGADYACYLTATGTVKCWGQGERSQLGQPINGTLNHAIPVAPELVADIELVRAGKAHACALKSVQGGMDQAICWGANDKRQANPTSPSRVTDPVVIEGLAGVKELALGEDHTCALLNSGRIKCWGGNREGQVGIGEAGMTPVNTPTWVQAGDQQPLTGQSALFGFGQNNCSLGRNGTLNCWGAMFETSLPTVVTRLVR